MSVSGLCSVCEQREAEFVCDRCGTAVCEAHYEPAKGLCATCVGETGVGETDPTDPETDTEFQM